MIKMLQQHPVVRLLRNQTRQSRTRCYKNNCQKVKAVKSAFNNNVGMLCFVYSLNNLSSRGAVKMYNPSLRLWQNSRTVPLHP